MSSLFQDSLRFSIAVGPSHFPSSSVMKILESEQEHTHTSRLPLGENGVKDEITTRSPSGTFV